MSKIVILKLFYRNRNMKESEIIEKDLVNKGFIIYDLGEVEKKDINLNYIKEKIEYISNIYEGKAGIVFYSNIKDLTFAVFRMYNDRIISAIYFIEKYNYKIFKDDIFQKIAELKNISEEKIKGKIYLNIDYNTLDRIDNVKEYLGDLRYIGYFSMIKNIRKLFFEKPNEKEYKEYIFERQQTYNRELNNFNNKLKKIYLDKEKNEIIKIEKIYEMFNEDFSQFILYCSVEFLKEKIEKEIIKQFIFQYCKFRINDNNVIRKNNFKDELKIFLYGNRDFIFKIRIISMLVSFKEFREEIIKLLIETIKIDESRYDLQMYCLINSLYYDIIFGLPIYDNYWNDTVTIIERLIEKYTGNIKLNILEGKENKIAIISDQVVMTSHSTAKAALDHAINIKKNYPEKIVKIFTEEYFWYQSDFEKNYMFACSKSPHSLNFKEQHKKYLEEQDAADIEIVYMDPEIEIKEKVEKLIFNIEKFNPEIILNFNNSYSIAQKILSKYYKNYYFTLGAVNFQQNCDFDFYFSEEYVKKYPEFIKKYRILKTHAITFQKIEKLYCREEYINGLTSEDYVLVTVGLRLKAELDGYPEYVEEVMKKISKNNKYKWIFVGGEKSELILKKYSEYIDKQIFFVKHEKYLGALYQICDVYLNPPRNGGGYSIAEAMFYGLPVLSIKGSEAGDIWLEKENIFENNEKYVEMIDMLYENKELYSKISKLVKDKIEKMSFKKYIEEIFSNIYF